MQARTSWLTTPVMFLFMLLAFTGGVTLERFGWLPDSPGRPPAHVGKTFEPFWETWNLAEEYYVDRTALKPERMTRGAIEGLLVSLGDVGHTTYLSPEELKFMTSSLEGKLEGIGARLTIRQQQPTVAETFPASPARKAGLKPGDVLLSVDGKPVAGMPVDRIAKMVRGAAGTPVHIQAKREGVPKVLDLNITRGKVEIPLISWHMIPDQPIAHLALREFGTHADEQFRAALESARSRGAKGLLFDIRGNPGGLKDQAVAVTSEFLKDGVVFIEQDAAGKQEKVPVQAGGVATDIPLVVLIDQGSASSSEIFAGAIQDHHRAKLVGTKTFGTGTVLRPFPLSDGGAVLLAVAQWLTPDGRQIWHKGIPPDVEIPLPENAELLIPTEEVELTPARLAQTDDRQLLKGLEVLREAMKK